MGITEKNNLLPIFTWVSAFGLLLAVQALRLINFDSINVEVHDNLDSVHVWLSVLNQYELFFAANNVSVPFLGGISRGFLPSELQVANLLYYFYDPLVAHHINYSLKLIIGTFSFYILGRYLFGYNSNFQSYGPIVSLAYALLPGYENLFIAQASIPLIVYLYLKTLNTKHKHYLLFLLAIIYPFLSEFSRYGIFICGLCFFSTLYLAIKRDRRWLSSLLFLVCLVLGYVISDYRVFYTMLFLGEETIRSSMIKPNHNFFRGVLEVGFRGQYHAQSLHQFIILPILLFSFYLVRNEIINLQSNKTSLEIRVILSCAIFITAHSIIFGLYGIESLRLLVYELVPPLTGFNFSRFIWFNPLLWYLIFSASLLIISLRFNQASAISIASVQLALVFFYPSYGNDFANTIKCRYITDCHSSPTYREFFSGDFFQEIKEDINYSGEAVVAFGFHPSVLSFNGFYTLDGYHNAYSLEYKTRFRKIIAPSLDRSESYRRYFDNWGGRAYLFADAVDFKPNRDPRRETLDIPLDILAAKKENLVYVFSLYRLNISKVDDIKLVKNYANDESFYNIFLYKITD